MNSFAFSIEATAQLVTGQRPTSLSEIQRPHLSLVMELGNAGVATRTAILHDWKKSFNEHLTKWQVNKSGINITEVLWGTVQHYTILYKLQKMECKNVTLYHHNILKQY